MKKTFNLSLTVLFIICAIPRIVLTFLNKESNDDHVTTVLLWQETGEYPAARDCWECFQPPLFYSIIKLACTAVKANEYHQVFKVIQVLNLFFSLIVCWLIIWFIHSINKDKLIIIALSLFWALNPELVSIGALATNDILVILLGMSFTLVMVNYLKEKNIRTEITLYFLLFLLGITKGNGLLFIGIVPIALLIKAVKLSPDRLTVYARNAFFSIITVLLIGYCGNYIHKYTVYNNAFITNVDPPYEKATWNTPGNMKFRKGVNTIKEAIFEFPIASLIEQPYNLNGYEDIIPHRQNLWTQMLGQFSNHLFERHPPKWVSSDNDMENFARVNIVLHILLFTVLIFTILKSVLLDKLVPNLTSIFHFICVLLFLLFVINYAVKFRDFSFMKVVFIYPAYISLIYISSVVFTRTTYHRLISVLLLACVVMYQVNYIYLVKALLP